MLVVGARPNFVKCAPVMAEIFSKHPRIDLTVIHTGQHYDLEMSEIFFHQLGSPRPVVNLRVGSGTHATQTLAIMKRLEDLLLCGWFQRPDIMLVPGDVNTTLASALCAAKLCIPVAHLEAGMRSGDMTMPEEVNRKLIDHCSTLHLAPTPTAMSNLKREGIEGHYTGDTMFDALLGMAETILFREQFVREKFGLHNEERHVLVTLHRPSNVDNPIRLQRIWKAINAISDGTRVVFPVHPRTRVALGKHGNDAAINLVQPLGYIETMALLRGASCVLSDSGGIQKEAFFLNVPCVTVRTTTEWPETLSGGANILVSEPEKLADAVLARVNDGELSRRIAGISKHDFGDGHAAQKVADLLER